MNKDKLFAFIQALTDKDFSKYKDNFFHYMNLNGSFPKTVYGLIFDKEDIESGLFEELIEVFNPMCIYCGNSKMLKMIEKLDYAATLVPYWQGNGFVPLYVLPTVNGSIVMDRGLIKEVKI